MANYTDSEGEEAGEGGSEGEGDGNPSLAERLGRLGAAETTSAAAGTLLSDSGSRGSTPAKKAKLVSYHDPDAGLSDDERVSHPHGPKVGHLQPI